MTTATIQEVQTHLPALIAQMKPGEELVITEHDQTVARLVAERR
jgi:antitoxin (DNA-binding transcriptional repressor) of toxin-antitoxin stability system